MLLIKIRAPDTLFMKVDTTHMYLKGISLSRIKYQGRWAAESSLSVYLQEAMSHLVWHSVSQDRATSIELALAQARDFISRPPLTTALSFLPRQAQWRALDRVMQKNCTSTRKASSSEQGSSDSEI